MTSLTARKTFPFGGKPRNPSDSAVSEWDRAITATDRHSNSCKACSKRTHLLGVARLTGTLTAIDPYTLCDKATALYQAEREAMAAYRKLGSLPTRVPS